MFKYDFKLIRLVENLGIEVVLFVMVRLMVLGVLLSMYCCVSILFYEWLKM